MKIGVDVGGTNIRACLLNGQKIVEIKKVALQNQDDLQSTLDQIIQLIWAVHQPGICGIGVGVPSVVDLENGIVYDVVNIPSWKKVPLKAVLEKEFGAPVYVNNDVNCFTLGEKLYGIARDFTTVAGITIGTGIQLSTRFRELATFGLKPFWAFTIGVLVNVPLGYILTTKVFVDYWRALQ